jgi:uncharacterized membrane protein
MGAKQTMNNLLRAILIISGFFGASIFSIISPIYLSKTDLTSILVGVSFMVLAVLCIGLVSYVTIALSEKKTQDKKENEK